MILVNPPNNIIITPEEVGIEVYEDFFVKTNEHFPMGAAIASEQI